MAPESGYIHDDAFDEGDLQVSELHRIHYAQHGKRGGKPVVFLHGGPGGGGCSKSNAVFFDPAVYHVVLLDQRGAGKSEPTSETRENNTKLLIEDIETLRKHVGVQKWHMVFGGSWGSTLSLAYAEAHPEVCGSLVLRGVFFGTKQELDYALAGHVTAIVWPEEYETFTSYVAEAREKGKTTLQAYHELIHSDDHDRALEAAKRWNQWELSVSHLQQPASMLEVLEDPRWVMSHAKLETHYFVNECFFEKDQLLRDVGKIKHIPTSIVQGRYDLVCPPRAAWELHKALPKSKLYWSATAGHSAKEPGTLKKLIEVCDEYAALEV
ncbi:proline iminopeptidase [Lophiostoma macrostomum CBS 122681]|uniref:Proline iminopeptidase n=1 Tax=Lophiostoma macrostomum CBS 122681 TaxID=1314788 RepID=A0A6A6SNE0_9PLEO|nr:proline iminopeptidase [Lophiostoma macrostomum CBS 122681]